MPAVADLFHLAAVPYDDAIKVLNDLQRETHDIVLQWTISIYLPRYAQDLSTYPSNVTMQKPHARIRRLKRNDEVTAETMDWINRHDCYIATRRIGQLQCNAVIVGSDA